LSQLYLSQILKLEEKGVRMSEKVKPIYASGVFTFSRNGKVTQYTIFYYEDPENYYASLNKSSLDLELKNIKSNLQYFLDQETILINGEKSRARVIWAKLGLIKVDLPFVEFIITFRGRLRRGSNEYVNYYEEEEAEYPYEVTWVMPGRILDIKIHGQVTINKNIVYVKVNRGTKVGGEEKITFFI